MLFPAIFLPEKFSGGRKVGLVSVQDDTCLLKLLIGWGGAAAVIEEGASLVGIFTGGRCTLTIDGFPGGLKGGRVNSSVE